MAALFAELSPGRRREITSAVAHYIAGVLDRESMVEIVESLSKTADWKPGDRVKTLRGSTHGVIVRLHPDGRVAWRLDGTDSEQILDTRYWIWDAEVVQSPRSKVQSRQTNNKGAKERRRFSGFQAFGDRRRTLNLEPSNLEL